MGICASKIDYPHPTIVLLPGAFHVHTAQVGLGDLCARVHESGYPVVATTMPSVNTANTTVNDDVAFIREKILRPLIEDGKDVVLVMHSYSSLPGSAAIHDLSKRDRHALGIKGGIIGLVFLTALVPREGDSLYSMLNGVWPECFTVDNPTGLLRVNLAQKYFYNDVPELLASSTAATLVPHSIASFTSPCPSVAWADATFTNRRAYIRATDDIAFPLDAQNAMLANSRVDWIVRDIKTGHCPFVNNARELAVLIVELTELFMDAAEKDVSSYDQSPLQRSWWERIVTCLSVC